jgi:hypothetical protein
MAMLMQALLESWRDVERHCAEVADGDPEHTWCLELSQRMRSEYQRLFEVFPHCEVESARIRELLAEAIELRHTRGHTYPRPVAADHARDATRDALPAGVATARV